MKEFTVITQELSTYRYTVMAENIEDVKQNAGYWICDENIFTECKEIIEIIEIVEED